MTMSPMYILPSQLYYFRQESNVYCAVRPSVSRIMQKLPRFSKNLVEMYNIGQEGTHYSLKGYKQRIE